MADIKHVGRVKATGRKCLVAYRTLPGESDACLIIPTESLDDASHDALIQLVESPAAQNSFEFANVLARAKFPDGSTMLPSLHAAGKLMKVATDQIEMLPNFQSRILLSELNQLIAEQMGVSVQDLAIKDTNKEAEVVDVASVKDLAKTKPVNDQITDAVTQSKPSFDSPEAEAKFYRSQADKLAKQAADFRRKAEELAPTKKAK